MTTDVERVPFFRNVRDNAQTMLGGNGEGTLEEKMVRDFGGRVEGKVGQGGKGWAGRIQR